MIKLFRAIRQNLIGTGKIQSYLIYAIGEIVLVVIGILIALQINNWNEEYKDRQLEQAYYCRLLEDINQDQLLLESLKNDNNERLKSNNELIHLLQLKISDREKVIKVLRETITRIRFKFRPSLSAFEDLKSSGKLNILTDLILKKLLLNYYAVMEGYGDISDIIADASLTIQNNPSKDFQEIGFQDIYYVKNEIDTTLIDIQKLKSDSYPSEKIRNQLLSDAIFHLNTNARKKELYQSMQDEIVKIQMLLSAKCENHKK